jgi:hypothetical protein
MFADLGRARFPDLRFPRADGVNVQTAAFQTVGHGAAVTNGSAVVAGWAAGAQQGTEAVDSVEVA